MKNENKKIKVKDQKSVAKKSKSKKKMKSEWNTLGLSKAVLETIDSLNFQKMTPVQVRILISK